MHGTPWFSRRLPFGAALLSLLLALPAALVAQQSPEAALNGALNGAPDLPPSQRVFDTALEQEANPELLGEAQVSEPAGLNGAPDPEAEVEPAAVTTPEPGTLLLLLTGLAALGLTALGRRRARESGRTRV